LRRTLQRLVRYEGMLDDEYTLYESGKVLHEFDKHIYPGGQNLKEELLATQLNHLNSPP